ncbi:MAG: flagellin FliC3 [Lachnospiraceae bacterium]|jgi:flagellin|nr:flagellin FliC3 [Lachnospiraceae bacterium]
MRINYNVSAMLANNKLANNDNLLSKSLERLSSGLKVNSAKDNPAGLAMAKRMNAQIEGLSVANQSAGDGVSIIETADGAMSEVSEILQRMNELAVKAANGPNSDKDRSVIQDEVKQLTEEITRIAEATEFNGQKLLNGEFSLKGYVQGNLDVKVSSYSTEVTAKIYNIDQLVIEENPMPTDESDRYRVKVFTPKSGDFPDGVTATMKDNLLSIQGVNGFKMTLDLSRAITNSGFPDTVKELEITEVNGASKPLVIDATGIGPMVVQVGANEGQTLEMDIPKISLSEMGLDNFFVKDGDGTENDGKGVWTLNVSTEQAATEAIERIDGAIQFVSGIRGRLGAYQNRLETTINSLDVTSENVTAAYSRIMDVDMAEEMTNYTTYQVMTQAATSMLAQANERPSSVLQLLQ